MTQVNIKLTLKYDYRNDSPISECCAKKLKWENILHKYILLDITDFGCFTCLPSSSSTPTLYPPGFRGIFYTIYQVQGNLKPGVINDSYHRHF